MDVALFDLELDSLRGWEFGKYYCWGLSKGLWA